MELLQEIESYWTTRTDGYSEVNQKELAGMQKAAWLEVLTEHFPKKEKKDFIFVGMVCVREQYQGQGYMRKVLGMAFSEGNRLHVPVILETDAKSKCDKYMHLGMELEGVRDMGAYGKMYDLIKYPD